MFTSNARNWKSFRILGHLAFLFGVCCCHRGLLVSFYFAAFTLTFVTATQQHEAKMSITVTIHAGEMKQIAHFIEGSGKAAAKGRLYGLWTHSDQPVIQYVVDDAKRDNEKIKDYLEEKHCLRLVGYWSTSDDGKDQDSQTSEITNSNLTQCRLPHHVKSKIITSSFCFVSSRTILSLLFLNIFPTYPSPNGNEYSGVGTDRAVPWSMDFYFKLLERSATKNTSFINAETK